MEPDQKRITVEAAPADPNDRAGKLNRINEVLMDRVERLEASKGTGWSMFQAAVALEQEVNARTRDLERALLDLSNRNRELALAREAAEEANRSKTRFLRAAGHDLLQPIAAARLFLGAIRDSSLQPAQAELVEQLGSAVQSVEELMQAVLEISRLDSQRIEFSRQPVALGDLFTRLAREYAPQAEARGLRLVFAPTRAVVDSDPAYLRRITQNLVSNAIKYTPEGGVLVGARRRGARVWLEVRDSGIGIAADDRARIFDEFQRGPGEGAAPGMGLGLAIVRRACAKLGHPIHLDSLPGRGTLFRVGLPLVQNAADPPPVGGWATAPQPSAQTPVLTGLSAILIENDPSLQRAYAIQLRDRAGMTVHVAASSAEAEAVLDANPGLRPDIVIADYQLDHGDTGLFAIAALRERLGPVPALMVTAHDSAEVARACGRLDVPLLLKPVTAEALRHAIAGAIMAQR
ncbi:response regulator [Paracoccus suum]|uniref:histidine kinase n=1 Tax=Paracoccus suum TaxID=2259340 RepID=A0A344PM13_9RHOB|nr:hybrid sensor histidine kinase/response regulator [Paracoccus suum]AXC50418.1 response regulator [Paracoccus suum]